MKIFVLIENNYSWEDSDHITDTSLIGVYTTKEEAIKAQNEQCGTHYETCVEGCCVDNVSNGIIHEAELDV
jgi:hypothetical protein